METKPTFDITTILKRPETLTLIVAVIVSALAAAQVPERAGLPLPEKEIATAVAVFWAIFIGATFEGKYRGIDYAGGLRQLFGSTKFRLGLVVLVGMVVNATLAPFGAALPEEAVVALGNFVIAAVLGIAGVDGLKAA